jgi:hypothetical protein
LSSAEEDSYLGMGPFILALDSFYGLTNNFIICFEAISYSISLSESTSLLVIAFYHPFFVLRPALGLKFPTLCWQMKSVPLGSFEFLWDDIPYSLFYVFSEPMH